jgi:hypothetical protein
VRRSAGWSLSWFAEVAGIAGEKERKAGFIATQGISGLSSQNVAVLREKMRISLQDTGFPRAEATQRRAYREALGAWRPGRVALARRGPCAPPDSSGFTERPRFLPFCPVVRAVGSFSNFLRKKENENGKRSAQLMHEPLTVKPRDNGWHNCALAQRKRARQRPAPASATPAAPSTALPLFQCFSQTSLRPPAPITPQHTPTYE